VQDARTFIAKHAALCQATSHLHTDIQHRLGDLDLLALQKRSGIRGKLQGNQGLLIIATTQNYAPVRQFDYFKKRCWHDCNL